jgi:WS/DGAT/MGAT family acyltransferase
MDQLSPLDASFLYFETANAPMHIGAIAVYDQSSAPGGRVTFKGILANLEKRLPLARCFRQRVVRVPLNLDHPYWIEDPDFDLEFHVRHIALPQPGDWRQLCIQAARLHSRALDPSRPLWELYVIEGLDNVPGLPKGSFAVLTKIHHAAIDGVSGAEVTAVIHDVAPDAEPPPPKEPWRPDAVPSTAELLARTAVNDVIHPFRLGRVLLESVPAVARLRAELRSSEVAAAGTVPRTRFNGTVTPHRVVDGRSFDLREMRAIKSAVDGATVNDAVLAVVGGALRKYLESHRELPADSLLAFAPISVRTESQRGTAGNQVTGMITPLHTEIADPVERLRAVHTGTVQSKAATNAIGARLLTDYTQFIPSSLAGLAARLYTGLGLANRMRPFANTVVTNIPGPQIPLYFSGARLVTTFGLGPVLDGMGLIHPVFSYCGQITISATSCRNLMPDPAFYAQCLQESFDELSSTTRAARPEPSRTEAGVSA